MVAADHQRLVFEDAATPTTMPLSFTSQSLEGMFPTANDAPENPAPRTFTSKVEEGGRGDRQSDFVGAMWIFGSKSKDIEGHIRPPPVPVEESETEESTISEY